MKVTDKANNGQVLMVYKELNELTIEEREYLGLPYGEKLTDYADFQVRYNKKGKLLGVKPNKLTENARKALYNDTYNNIDVVDAMAANFESLTGCKPWKTLGVKGAKKRVHYALANQAIRERKEISKNKKKTLVKSH